MDYMAHTVLSAPVPLLLCQAFYKVKTNRCSKTRAGRPWTVPASPRPQTPQSSFFRNQSSSNDVVLHSSCSYHCLSYGNQSSHIPSYVHMQCALTRRMDSPSHITGPPINTLTTKRGSTVIHLDSLKARIPTFFCEAGFQFRISFKSLIKL